MAFCFLALSILCVFPFCKIVILRQPIWQYLLLLSVITAYHQEYINLYAVVVIVFYLGLLHFSVSATSALIRSILTPLFVIASLGLALHWFPGFNNQPIVVNEQLTSNAIAFTLYANFDKALAGLMLSAYFFTKNKTLKPIRVGHPLSIIAITILAALITALILGLMEFAPKVPEFWFLFIAINLFFTCVAEEALFRGIIQTKLSKVITSARFALLAPVISTGLFSLAHFSAGASYMLVAAVAGFGYGYIFYKTQRLEWAILCHRLVNVFHFFLFTYPMLATPSY
ncbi:MULTISPECIES: CPBP family intramembrane glutamic endopeptidase [unclassified Pseudoalteromonas]|uniref:CPBP family intramembrane glutamic endopeptidase n=1 Tax=unclassified Pseudoalteromonas TaxID=194690 RepID=UPI0015FEFC00|nr:MULTISPECIES: CPBP family intramembrane glutamic endopeptidase [unclassified Pseudoalteromonas]MBB1335748.1 CPBP family intramembrane metalloprotease [Pseudoalteromonas sp. SR41-6]MBB1461437.1 CPBP family intramembrane metalloprotease [Pseudoalteromonas sp. SG41-8]